MVKTSIIIPCYNEAEGIPQLCSKLGELVPLLQRDGQVEIFFVDDGSADNTANTIRQHAQAIPFKIISHASHRGIGEAFRSGFSVARGQEIVTIDSDCTYDPMKIVDLLRMLRSGFDVVTGSPYHPLGTVAGVHRWRLFLSKSLSLLYWLVLPGKLYTYTSCFRAYRRDALDRLKSSSDDFLAVTELLAQALVEHLRVGELPVRLQSRKFGRSKIKIMKVSVSHLAYLMKLIFRRLVGKGAEKFRAIQSLGPAK